MPRLALAGVALVGIAAMGWCVRGHRPVGPLHYPIPGEVDTFTVEVLNATQIDGLARATTGRLRRLGVDVVFFGTERSDTLDSTLVVIRRGDSAAALRVRDALGFGRVVDDPDPSLLLDVTVLLGADAAARDLDP